MSIASVLNTPVVCEGVETEVQLASLRASGVSHIQGYLTGRPIPASQLENVLQAMAADSQLAITR
ncbi:MAG: hypothetical protein R2706_04265 [Acidimicrobiales bacterium]